MILGGGARAMAARRTLRRGGLLLALAGLAGCAGDAPVGSGAGGQRAMAYCYRTLADVDCYLAPVGADLLVGVDIPPPPPPR